MAFTDETSERELTDLEQESLRAANRWIDLYNTDDMETFVREAYTPDGDVTLFDGLRFPGRAPSIVDMDKFIVHEEKILAARPGRRLRVRRAAVSGRLVTLEADFVDLADESYVLPICAVLEIRDGKVLHDHTYIHRDDLAGAVDSLANL